MEDDQKSQQEKAAHKGKHKRRRIGRVAIFQIPGSPNWYIDYSLDGKQYRTTLKTNSEKQAEILAKRKDAELVLGAARKPSRAITITEAAEKYVQARGRHRSRNTVTIKIYTRSLRFFAEYARHCGIHRLDRVDADLLEGYEDQLSTKGLNDIVPANGKQRRLRPQKPRSVRENLKIVRQLIKWALKRQILQEDPAPGYDLPPELDEDEYCWTPDECRRIRGHFEPLYQDAFDFYATTGLRSNELCWLKKEDVFLVGKPFIRIRPKKCGITGEDWSPKFGKSRIVPLCPQAADIARRAIESSTGPWLFSPGISKQNPAGRFSSERMLDALRRAMQRAGVERGRIHTFRHVFCSFAANNKVPPFQVMKILGHGSLDIVLRYYHVGEDELLSALDGVDFGRLLGPDGKETA